MPDFSTPRVAVGDEVRVHYHPLGLRQSFAEGVARRIEVTTLRGRGFLIDTTREVILGRERAVQSGRQDYILYEHPSEFAGRIEMLSQASRLIGAEPEGEQPAEAGPDFAAEEAVDENRPTEPQPDQEEGQTPRSLGNVISAVFGRWA